MMGSHHKKSHFVQSAVAFFVMTFVVQDENLFAREGRKPVAVP